MLEDWLSAQGQLSGQQGINLLVLVNEFGQSYLINTYIYTIFLAMSTEHILIT